MARILCKTCDENKKGRCKPLNLTQCDKYYNYKERLELENTEFNYGHNVEHYHTDDGGERISEKNPLRHYD